MSASPAGHPDTWVVVPVYNEATVLGEVVRGLRERFDHVVCVDDGSTDDSAQVAREAGARVLVHPVNLGQGAALQTGIEYAVAQPAMAYLVTFDADGQHQVDDAEAMVEVARTGGFGAVFGSRFLDARNEAGLFKRLVLRVAAWFTRQSTGMRLTDAHNGLRVLRRDAAEQVHLHQDGMAHASEIVLHVARTHLPWTEYGVHVLYTEYSRGKGQSTLNAVNILVDLFIK